MWYHPCSDIVISIVVFRRLVYLTDPNPISIPEPSSTMSGALKSHHNLTINTIFNMEINQGISHHCITTSRISSSGMPGDADPQVLTVTDDFIPNVQFRSFPKVSLQTLKCTFCNLYCISWSSWLQRLNQRVESLCTSHESRSLI